MAVMSVRGGSAAVQNQRRDAHDAVANARGALPRRYNGGVMTACPCRAAPVAACGGQRCDTRPASCEGTSHSHYPPPPCARRSARFHDAGRGINVYEVRRRGLHAPPSCLASAVARGAQDLREFAWSARRGLLRSAVDVQRSRVANMNFPRTTKMGSRKCGSCAWRRSPNLATAVARFARGGARALWPTGRCAFTADAHTMIWTTSTLRHPSSGGLQTALATRTHAGRLCSAVATAAEG